MGQAIGNAALAISADLALMVGGVLGLVTLICGLIILTDIGGRGLQQHVRGYVVRAFIGAIFCGSYTVIAQKIITTAH